MKKLLCLLLVLITLPSLCAADQAAGKVDLNISSMNAMMTFATVKSIIETPNAFVGRRAKITGWYNESMNPATKTVDRFVIVVNMTACCFNDGSIYLPVVAPGDGAYTYPEVGQQCEVVGVIGATNDGERTGLLQMESIHALDHWQEEVWW